MEDIIDIIVTETTNTIEITSQASDELIDVNIIDNREDITLNVTPTLVEININSLTGNFGVEWGDITGTLADQTDLNTALGLKADLVGGKVPSSQLPSYVDDIVEVANYAALPATGETGKIYVVLDTNLIYRWSGSAYIEIKDSSAVWGAITGTLSNQTDLQSALNAKQNQLNGTGFVKASGTTISYDNSTYTVNGGFIAGQLIFAQNTTSLAGSTSLSWDNTNGYLKLGLAIVSTAKLQVGGNAEASSFIKTGGTSSQFLKADGSVDSSTYLTTGTASSTYLPLAGGTMTGNLLLRDNNTIGGTNYYIGQTMASNDFWRIYGNTVAEDQGEMIFELGDNAGAISSNGQRFRFFYSNSSSGTVKSPLIIDYNTITIDASASITGAITNSINTGASFIAQPSTGTNQAIAGYFNDGGQLYVGIDNSTGSGFGKGNYAYNIYGNANRAMVFSTDGTARLTIAATSGAATFSSSLTAGGQITMAYGGNPRLTLQDTDSGAGNVGILFKENTTDKWALASVGGAFQFFNEANSSNALYITSGNNIGIGTTAPSAKLDVETSSGGYAVVIKNTSAGGDYLKMTGDSGNTAFEFGSGGTGADAFLNMYADNSQKVLINADGSSYFNGGNVGIGTTAPQKKLDIFTTANSGTEYQLSLRNGSGDNNVSTGIAFGFNTTSLDPDYLSAISSIVTNRTTRAADLTFLTAATGSLVERMRITSGGWSKFTSNDGSGTMVVYNSGLSASNYMMFMGGGSQVNGIGTGANGAATLMTINRDSGSLRSINAAGTLNASGADYAEYMQKSDIETIINKGDLVGINSEGLLTDIFEESISFAIKSTDPSYVGNDKWANEDKVGKMPMQDDFGTKEDYEIALDIFKSKVEIERAKVDRIAFSGQVPCNVLGANVGNYIIPVNDNGKIKGIAVSNPSFEQYQISVGKVWKIMEDGRAWVAVKIG